MKPLIKLDRYDIERMFGNIPIVDILKQAFEAGFNASGEGYNGEFGADDSDIKESCDKWLKEMGVKNEK